MRKILSRDRFKCVIVPSAVTLDFYVEKEARCVRACRSALAATRVLSIATKVGSEAENGGNGHEPLGFSLLAGQEFRRGRCQGAEHSSSSNEYAGYRGRNTEAGFGLVGVRPRILWVRSPSPPCLVCSSAARWLPFSEVLGRSAADDPESMELSWLAMCIRPGRPPTGASVSLVSQPAVTGGIIAAVTPGPTWSGSTESAERPQLSGLTGAGCRAGGLEQPAVLGPTTVP